MVSTNDLDKEDVVISNKMVRPHKMRRIRGNPESSYFKPAGIPKRELETTQLSKAEFESLRLKEVKELDQQQAAEEMNVSQPTFHRILSSARKKIAKAIVTGQAIKIENENKEQ